MQKRNEEYGDLLVPSQLSFARSLSLYLSLIFFFNLFK